MTLSGFNLVDTLQKGVYVVDEFTVVDITGQDPGDWHDPVPPANHLAMSHLANGREGCQEIGHKGDQFIGLAKWRCDNHMLARQRRSFLATPLLLGKAARFAMIAMKISR